jgi:hypothetical protein
MLSDSYNKYQDIGFVGLHNDHNDLSNIHIYLDIGFVGVHPNNNKEEDNMERINDDIYFSIYAL